MARTNGEILRDLRKKNNFTMKELGDRLKVGVSFINDMEKGRKKIPEYILERIIIRLLKCVKRLVLILVIIPLQSMGLIWEY